MAEQVSSVPSALAEFSRSRSQIYWFLSRFFIAPPDAEFLHEIAGWLERLDNGTARLQDKGLMLLQAALNQDEHRCLEQRLRVEHARLFLGLRKGYGLPPPYESLYLESRLNGTVTAAVVQSYQRAGFGTIEESVGPQDHIAAELKFMAFLCHEESQAYGRSDRRSATRYREFQKDFLNQHLLRWVPDYCRDLEKESRERFFIGVARLTSNSVIADEQYLLDTIKNVEV